jgi:hypothetical protein
MANTNPPQDPGLQFLALRKQYDEHPGQATLHLIGRLDRTRQILVTNSRELDEQLEFFADPRKSFQLWAVERRAELNEFLAEIGRFLHNYLASVKTLVDHTRHEMKAAYAGTALHDEYQAQVDDLFSVGPPAFIQNLRNYTLHYRLADGFAQLSHTPGQDFETGVFLDRERLLEWDNWSAAAKVWLADQPDRIDFREPLHDYETRVLGFYTWVDERIRTEHAAALAEIETLRAQMAAMLP